MIQQEIFTLYLKIARVRNNTLNSKVNMTLLFKKLKTAYIHNGRN